jgi:hypothetical protein
MTSKGELAFLKANLAKLSPTSLSQLKRDIESEKKRRKVETAAGLKGRVNDLQPRLVGCTKALPGMRLPSPTITPRDTAGRRKARSWTCPTGKVQCNQPAGTRVSFRSWVRASACTGRGNPRPRPGGQIYRLHGRTST